MKELSKHILMGKDGIGRKLKMKKQMKKVVQWFGEILGYNIVILRRHNIVSNVWGGYELT